MSVKLLGKDDTPVDGSGLDDYIYITPFTAIESGLCNKVLFKSPGNGNVKVAVYRDDTDALIAKQDAPQAVTEGWNQIMLEAPCSIVQGNVYYLAVISDEDIIAYDDVGSGSGQYYNSQNFAGFTWYTPLGSGWVSQGSRCTIIAGWSLETFVETGKTQVIKAAQDVPNNLAIFTEEAKLQAILAIIGEWDAMYEIYDETGKLQVILGVQGSADNATFLDVGHTVIISAIEGHETLAIFLESVKTQIVLAAQGSVDNAIFLENVEQVILAVHGSAGNAIFLESLEQVIAVIQGRTDTRVLEETVKLIAVLVKQGSWDNLIRLSLQQSISGGVRIHPVKTHPIKRHSVYGQKEV